MLTRNGTPFAEGVSRFTDSADGRQEGTAKIFVKIQPGSLETYVLAQLDTGAAYSVLATELAEELSLLDAEGVSAKMSTRVGEYIGKLVRTRIHIIADKGSSLSVDATVWVCREWPEQTFLGYNGLLERIRFAIDPSDNSFYFGACDR